MELTGAAEAAREVRDEESEPMSRTVPRRGSVRVERLVRPEHRGSRCVETAPWGYELARGLLSGTGFMVEQGLRKAYGWDGLDVNHTA